MTTLFEFAARLHASGAAEAVGIVIVKATLILLIARLLLAAVSRASAATKHAIATVALCSIAALPLLTPVIPAWNLAVLGIPEMAPPAQNDAILDGVAGGVSADAFADSTVLIDAARPSLGERIVNVGRGTWKGLLVLAVLAGALLMLGQMALGMLGVWNVARSSEPVEDDDTLFALDEARGQLALAGDVRLLRSSRITVPVVWGFLRPVLMLPAESIAWPNERLRVVILHELAHLKRLDGITLLVTRLAVSLYWFHPLAWSLERAGRSACEHACDDLVLAGGTKPSDYADHLLNVAKALPSFDPFRSVTLAMSRRSQLEGRLVSILQPGVRRGTFTARGVAVACALAAFVVFPLTAVRLIAQPPDEKKMKSDAVMDVRADLDAINDKLTSAKKKKDHDDDDEHDEREALERYRELRAARSDDAKEWIDVGCDLLVTGHTREAIDAYEHALRDENHAPTAMYKLGMGWSVAGDGARAIRYVEQAITRGYNVSNNELKESDDFRALRRQPGFESLIELNDDLQMRGCCDKSGKHGGSVPRTWQDTLRHHQTMTQKHPQQPRAWFNVGYVALRANEYEEGIAAFEKAVAMRYRVGTSSYNVACGHALAGNLDAAMQWLERSRATGFGIAHYLNSDDDLDNLRDDPRFRAFRRAVINENDEEDDDE